MSGFEDPNWPRGSAWLAGDSLQDTHGSVSVLGVPLNRSITPGRCDLAPDAVRKAMYRLATYDAAHHLDARRVTCHDMGDLPLAETPPADAVAPVRGAMADALGQSGAVVLLGGDNAVTRPGVHGLGLPLDRVGLLTLDAHLDLRDTNGGLHNGNPVRALLDDGMPGNNIVQIGIAPFANSSHYMGVAMDAGITVVTLATARSMDLQLLVHEHLLMLADRADAIYVDLDMDVLDRAFAPACPGSRPGGLTPGTVAEASYEIGKHPKVRAMDIVEIDPTKDVNDSTCLAAGQFLLSFATGVVRRLDGDGAY